MKRFFTLLRLEYNALFLPLCAIAGVMAALQISLFFVWTSLGVGVEAPLSYHIEQGGTMTIFMLAFMAVMGLVAARLLFNFMPSRSIYALLTLPIPRKRVYQAKLMAAWLAVAMLVAVQFAVLMIISSTGYWTHYDIYPELSRRGADLYLTMLEIPLLRILYPSGFLPRLMSIAAAAGSIAVALYVSAAVKARRFRAPVITVAVWVGLLTITFPLNEGTRGTGTLMFAFMLLCSYVATRMGMDLFETGEIAE